MKRRNPPSSDLDVDADVFAAPDDGGGNAERDRDCRAAMPVEPGGNGEMAWPPIMK